MLPQMASLITVMIFKRTTSSPEESLASNLQLDNALLSSESAAWSETEVEQKRPHRKKLWRDVSAVEVMGPVDNGERMMARNGERSVLRGNECTSMRIVTLSFGLRGQMSGGRTFDVLQKAFQVLEARHKLLLRISMSRSVGIRNAFGNPQSEAASQCRIARSIRGC